MIINKWDSDYRENDNVSVNDGVVTYFAEWDLEDGPIEFDAIAEDYKDGAYYDEEAEVTIEITNLLTGASEYHELVWGKDDDDADGGDEDGEDGDADEDDDEQ